MEWRYIDRVSRCSCVESFNGRMRDQLLNVTLFLSVDHARVVIAAGAEDYNQERPHSSLGFETPAAVAAELNKQWPASLRPAGSAAQAIAQPAVMRNKAAGLIDKVEFCRRHTDQGVNLNGRRQTTACELMAKAEAGDFLRRVASTMSNR